LEVESISKSFPGVLALSDINVAIEPGEVHCWIGENGAGKSTLIKILAGGQASDNGIIKIAGQVVNISSPHIAQELGLSFIFQELNVVNGLSVADNIFLGNELSKGPLVRKSLSEAKAREILERIGFGYLNPASKVGKLTTAEKQAVMVGRALSIEAKIIFMDETTATLDKDEVDRIFKVIQAIKAEGRSVVFVSHRLHEIAAIADRISVFKDGCIVGTYLSKDLPVSAMVRLMVGRDIANIFPPKDRQFGETILEVSELATKNVKNINLRISAGKINRPG
jgi:ribose transport system ATP-binding protein